MNRIIFSLCLFLWGASAYAQLRLGDERTDVYLPLLQGKRVSLFSNRTGCNQKGHHTLDVLLENGVDVQAIFSPEHGFRGTADAGERVSSSIDPKTGIPICSLYDTDGQSSIQETIRQTDILVVDIQDVGLRYYTYYISMLHLMEECGKADRQVVILDRPNPNGHFVDGPILDMSLKSGVGALPIPIVHGMTLGELAQMAQGERWVDHPCRLTVVPCLGYDHQTYYKLPIAPSPNLPNMRSILLYPSLCYFEGTCVSLGRGTPYPFQHYGHPDMKDCRYHFTPQSRPGAKEPPLKGERCWGVNLRKLSVKELRKRPTIDLGYVIDAYRRLDIGEAFFPGNFFDKLTGQTYVREMILRGASADEIAARWQEDVRRFRTQRRPYLLYAE